MRYTYMTLPYSGPLPAKHGQVGGRCGPPREFSASALAHSSFLRPSIASSQRGSTNPRAICINHDDLTEERRWSPPHPSPETCPNVSSDATARWPFGRDPEAHLHLTMSLGPFSVSNLEKRPSRIFSFLLKPLIMLKCVDFFF